MKSVFDDVIGQRIKNMLIAHAYEKGFSGTREQLIDSIYNLEYVVKTTRYCICDVIEGEIDIMASRYPEGVTPQLAMFIGGLIHATNMIENGVSVTMNFPPKELFDE